MPDSGWKRIKKKVKQIAALLAGASWMIAWLPLMAQENVDPVFEAMSSQSFIDEVDMTSTIGSDAGVRLAGTLPSKFDLRSVDKNGDGIPENYVSSVKLQNPWGLCWTFGPIAALETSFSYEADLPVDEQEIDFSEHHLAYYAYSPFEDNVDEPGHDQSGEGFHFLKNEKNQEMTGGISAYCVSLLSSGIGPVWELNAPYHGKEATVLNRFGYPVEADSEEAFCYSQEDDWSLPQEERLGSAYELSASNVLPNTVTALTDSNGQIERYTYNQEAINAVKSELVKGKAVKASIYADTSLPGQSQSYGRYLNFETWGHYCYDQSRTNHVVCLVGYDDNYSRNNFVPGHEPQGDGAWIVKNSWGASDNTFPNKSVWGEDGSGYFYVSYYDTSIQQLETFEFDLDNAYWENPSYFIGQYDYMPSSRTPNISSKSPIYMANVFDCWDNILVHSVSSQAATANCTVKYDIYRLNPNASSPTDGTLVVSKTAHYPYAGYHREELDRDYAFKKGDRIAVVITTRRADGTYEINYDQADSKIRAQIREVLDPSANQSYSQSVVNPGESYYGRQRAGKDSWQDWADYIAGNNQTSLNEMRELGIMEAIEKKDDATLSSLMAKPFNSYALSSYDNFPIKIYAEYMEDEIPFTDLGFEEGQTPHWAALSGYIPEVFKQGLMTGKTETTFAPDDVTKRAEVAETLFRLSGEDEANTEKYVDGQSGFVDVSPSAWYAPAMKWARENGVFTGSSVNGSLAARPDSPISREELALVLYRYGQSLQADQSDDPNKTYQSAPDAVNVSFWAAPGIEWAFDRGVMSGNGSDGTLRPKNSAKRGEYAKMLIESMNAYVK